jgi:hypothetical protein
MDVAWLYSQCLSLLDVLSDNMMAAAAAAAAIGGAPVTAQQC